MIESVQHRTTEMTYFLFNNPHEKKVLFLNIFLEKRRLRPKLIDSLEILKRRTNVDKS